MSISANSLKVTRGVLAAMLAALLLAGCAGHEEARVAKLVDANPSPAQFSICHGNSCRLRSDITLSEAQWQQVREVFASAPADAIAERRLIAHAIGLMEVMAGQQAGTTGDAAGMGVHWNPDEQLDCIDETTNSTTYMRMMAADGLLRFHRVGMPAHRFVLSSWGPSNTATIEEIATGKLYAVDSYFLANGEPASVLPLDLWIDGWTPEDGPPPEA
jgi:hypothetical protein